MKRFLIVLVALFALASAAYSEELQSDKPKLQFSWGADAGASIDMSGCDMSSIDISANFGISRGWINFLGVGAEADIMVTSSTRSFPIFAQFRTNFSNKPSIVFWELKGGVALNYWEHNPQQFGGYASTGVGFYLARGHKFSSHIVIGYTYKQRNDISDAESILKLKDLHYASVKIGVSF